MVRGLQIHDSHVQGLTLRVQVLNNLVPGILVMVIALRVLGEYMGGCQNFGPFLGTIDIRCRIIRGIQKKTKF